MSEDIEPRLLQLDGGELIDMRTGRRVLSTEVNQAFADRSEPSVLQTGSPSKSYSSGKRRYLDDLPVPAGQSRAVSVILAYTLFGLVPTDIAHILSVDVAIVEGILSSDAYTRMLDGVLQNVREHDKDAVRKKINKAAEDAADVIVGLIESDDEKVALKASMNILDRVAGDGLGAANDPNRNNAGLTIRIIDERDNPLDKVKVEIDA